jgi:hypothetical protein
MNEKNNEVTNDELYEAAMILNLVAKQDQSFFIGANIETLNSFFKKINGKDLFTQEEVERLSKNRSGK